MLLSICQSKWKEIRNALPVVRTKTTCKNTNIIYWATNRNSLFKTQLSPCGHPAIMDTPILRTVTKSRTKINYRCLSEINSHYYGLSLMRTLTRSPYGICFWGSSLYIATKDDGRREFILFFESLSTSTNRGYGATLKPLNPLNPDSVYLTHRVKISIS